MTTWEEEWYNELEKDRNQYVAISGRATLRQAFGLLGSPEVNGTTSWHLVVSKADETWAAKQFTQRSFSQRSPVAVCREPERLPAGRQYPDYEDRRAG